MTFAQLKVEKGIAPDSVFYLLRDADKDYVERVEKTDWETVQQHFVFTKDRNNALVFTHDDLYHPHATNPLGIVFLRGFAGSKAIRLVKK